MFSFVQRHCGPFFWLCWLLIAGLISLEAALDAPIWAIGLLLLPMNLLTWPIALAVWTHEEGKNLNHAARKSVCGLVLMTTIGPLLAFFL